MTEDGRVLPQDLEAEINLLRSLMAEPHLIDDVRGLLSAEHFYSDRNRTIYRAICRLSDNQKAIDVVTIARSLAATKELENIGGRPYLAEIFESSYGFIEHATAHADQIRSAADLRSVIEGCREALGDAYSMHGNPTELVSRLGEIVKRLEDEQPSREMSFEDFERSFFDMIANDSRQAISTGYDELDRIAKGCVPGELVVVGARPSVGKTAFAMNVAMNVAQQDEGVVFYSLEQGFQRLAERMLCRQSKYDLGKLRSPHLSEVEQYTIGEEMKKLKQLPILIDGHSEHRMSDIAASVRRICRKQPTKLVVIDYLTFLKDERHDTKAMLPKTERVGNMAKAASRMAKQNDVCVMLLAQLNRENQKDKTPKVPELHHLRDSGEIEQHCDQAWLLHRPLDEHSGGTTKDGEQIKSDPTRLTVAVRKNRDGMTGMAHLLYEGALFTVKNPPHDKSGFDDYAADGSWTPDNDVNSFDQSRQMIGMEHIP